MTCALILYLTHGNRLAFANGEYSMWRGTDIPQTKCADWQGKPSPNLVILSYFFLILLERTAALRKSIGAFRFGRHVFILCDIDSCPLHESLALCAAYCTISLLDRHKHREVWRRGAKIAFFPNATLSRAETFCSRQKVPANRYIFAKIFSTVHYS